MIALAGLITAAWLLMGCASILVVVAEFTRHGARWGYLFRRENFLWLLAMAAGGSISLGASLADYHRQSRHLWGR